MKVVLKKSTPTTTYTHEKVQSSSPQIWKGKNGKGIYIRLDDANRIWLSNDAVDKVVDIHEG